MGKIQKAQQNPIKSLLLHGTSKARCYTAPLKSLLLHSTSKACYYTAPLKAHCYMIIFLQNLTKPKCYFGTYFTKPKYYFWQLLIKPNNTLAPIYKSPNIILTKTITLCLKAQNYFLAKTYLHILKSLTYGKYKLFISQKYFFYKNLCELCLFFHNQLTTKAHVYHPWQNYSSCRDGQAQRSSTIRPS